MWFPNHSDTVQTLDSVKTGNFIEYDKHCKLHTSETPVLPVFF